MKNVKSEVGEEKQRAKQKANQQEKDEVVQIADEQMPVLELEQQQVKSINYIITLTLNIDHFSITL